MNDEDKNLNTKEEAVAQETVATTDSSAASAAPSRDQGNRRGSSSAPGFSRGPRQKNERKPRREPRARPEFDQRIIAIRRVTRVAAGGRRFSFSVALVAGNRKGQVGVGTGKAGDTSLAIEKALKNAKKNMITIRTTKEMSIPHEVDAKYSSARVEIMPARGRGITAGSSVRDVIDLAGLKDVTAKLRSGTKNKLNNARAAVKALNTLKVSKVAA
ncbi:MAG TPA: 30S ribosomal protein S5 [Candidatus Paceibacterota bacterium]|nr:30S ribosomal protein S5 [Candidatus Paceibacterota bacterium]